MRRAKDTLIVSSKGQIVLPAALRRKHGLSSGRVMRVEERDDEIVLRPVMTWKEIEQARDRIHQHYVQSGRRLEQELRAYRKRERADEARRQREIETGLQGGRRRS